MARRDETPRDLLFGLLALHNGLIDQDQLAAAFGTWSRARGRTLAEILVERGAIDAEDRSLLSSMAEKQLKLHGGDAEKSLASLTAGASTRDKLAKIGDPELTDSLPRVASPVEDVDPFRTASHAIGSTTSQGHRFRVLRPHAKGGLGAVFVAMDGELNREVALKEILDHHADNPVSRARFLIEAEITGGLEHPGIVPVYGLGHHDDGRPYYAMRFIRGDSLKEAIASFHGDEALRSDPGKKSLALRRLLRRFVDVCNAIDYAHGRGILHRDLKPGNVIVGKHGETLVVDWGLAKLMGKAEPRSTLDDERTLTLSSSSGSAETLPGSAIGTPSYMSPEQARGDLERLGPRSDVYSLGATLYCLLVGKAPFEGRDVGALLRDVQKGAFPPPRQVDPSIDKALEAVCLKAMATSPEDRHATARALAEDVDRWAADEPTSAWFEPASVRARRWMRRNRTFVTASAVALAAGVVGLAVVLGVQTKARNDLGLANGRLRDSLARETNARASLAAANADLTRSRAAVQARYDLAVDAIKTFHTGVGEDFLLKQEPFKELRNRLLKSAADYYVKLGALLGGETDLASRRALAQSHFELAELTSRVGRKHDALASHRALLATREGLAADPDAGPEAIAEVGRSLTAIASLLDATGRSSEAMEVYRRSESLLADRAGSGRETRASLASCRSALGWLLRSRGQDIEALETCRLARVDQEVLAEPPGSPMEARRDLAVSINRIAVLLFEAGRLVESEAEYRRALAIRRKLVDENPAVAELRSSLSDGHNNLGVLLVKVGRLAEAEAECRRAMELRRVLAEEYPSVADFRTRLANSHNGLADLLARMGRPLEAEGERRIAQSLYRKLVEDHPDVTDFLIRLSDTGLGLVTMLAEGGRLGEAEVECRRSMAIHRKLADENPSAGGFHAKLAEGHESLGNLLARMGRPLEAEAECRQALEIRGGLVQKNPRIPETRHGLASSHNDLSDVVLRLGRAAEARDGYDRAIALREALAAEVPKVTRYRAGLASSLRRRAVAHRALGDLAGSANDAQRALAVWEGLPSKSGEEWFEVACGHATLAGLAGLNGSGVAIGAEAAHAESAIALLRKAAEMGVRDAARLRREDVLGSLRVHPEYHILLSDLTFPADVFAR